LFTYLFFGEYLPPVRRVRLPFDMPVFHYPFADYAFQALRHGRFPEWDPTIYAGMPFAGNIQAALFYPGTWIMFLASAGRDHLSYQSLEDLVLLHVWLAFLLCYFWLARRLSPFAAACGAGVYAYGGYLLLMLQHLGVVVGYAWIPFGLLGIDEFVERDECVETRDWRPLWKVVAASAFALLAGYTPTWVLAAACFFCYAAFRRNGWKVAIATAIAVAVSLLVSMVQLLPSMQLSSLREAEARYGTGLRDPWYYLSYLVPNYWDFALTTDVHTNPGREYLYLGAPGLLGLLLLVFLRRREKQWSALPFVALLAAIAVVVTNPWDSVWSVIQHSTLVSQVIRDYYFLAGLSVAAAALAAIGIDRLLHRLEPPGARPTPLPSWTAYALCAILAAWSARLLYQWRWDTLARGWASAVDAAAILILFAVGLYVMARQTGRSRAWLATVLLIAVGVDYKAHGTKKRFDASRDDPSYKPGELRSLNAGVYRHLRENAVYRIAVDQTGPFPQTLRHFGLTTPMGFDPFLTSEYKKLIERVASFRSNWEFDVSPSRPEALDTLGIRFFLTTEQEPHFRELSDSPRFRLLEPSDTYLKAFEVVDPKAPYGWTRDGSETGIERLLWAPERREFTVRNSAGGTFYLAEQWNPGWSVQIDGVPAPVERWRGAFQAVTVMPGEHRVSFRFADRGLRTGAWISAAALAGLALALRSKRRSAQTR
jgi:hypothetical protein